MGPEGHRSVSVISSLELSGNIVHCEDKKGMTVNCEAKKVWHFEINI